MLSEINHIIMLPVSEVNLKLNESNNASCVRDQRKIWQKKNFVITMDILRLRLPGNYLFCRDSSVQKHVGKSDPVETMGALREEKNNFRGWLWYLVKFYA